MSQVLGDPPSHVRPAEHRGTRVAHEMPDLADASIIESFLEPLSGDAVAAAAGQIGERPPPLADPAGPLPEVEEEPVDAVIGGRQIPGEPGEALAGRAAEMKARRRIRVIPKRIEHEVRKHRRPEHADRRYRKHRPHSMEYRFVAR